MNKNALTPKIITVLVVKVFLLFCLWKCFFSQPLTDNQRRTGIILNFTTQGDNQ